MTQLWCTLENVFLVQLYFKYVSASKSRRYFFSDQETSVSKTSTRRANKL